MKNKKYNSIIVTIIIVLLIIVVVVLAKQKNKVAPIVPVNPAETAINQALTSDTTTSIKDSLNNINVDETVNLELTPIDQELKKL